MQMSAGQSLGTFLPVIAHRGDCCRRYTDMFSHLETIALAHHEKAHLQVYTPDHLHDCLAFWEEGQMPEGVPAQGLSLS